MRMLVRIVRSMETNGTEWTKQCERCAREAYAYCPAAHKVIWQLESAGYDKAQIGRFTVIVWSVVAYGCEMVSVYIPTTDRQLPDGRMIVGDRRLDTADRAHAKVLAVDIALAAIRDAGFAL
jgi:hypothetical protein